MNKTLSALMTKLQWQLNELNQQLLTLEQLLDNLELQLKENQQKITDACAIPAFILPEREIARLNFMICQSQNQDELNANKAELLAQKTTLTEKKIRLNTELKMLEKHQENQRNAARLQGMLIEQNNSDEWVLQRRETA